MNSSGGSLINPSAISEPAALAARERLDLALPGPVQVELADQRPPPLLGGRLRDAVQARMVGQLLANSSLARR
jgi:hypothetical protein